MRKMTVLLEYVKSNCALICNSTVLLKLSALIIPRLGYIQIRKLTCKELRMVNIQANALDSRLKESTPNTHVIPSRGSSITVALSIVLCIKKYTVINEKISHGYQSKAKTMIHI